MALWRQVVLAALLLGFAAFTTSLRGMFLIVSKVEMMADGGFHDHFSGLSGLRHGCTMDVLFNYMDILWMIYYGRIWMIHYG